jgi:hypothetical protein
MIDRSCFDLAAASRRGKEQEREAVRTAGHGDPDPASGWNLPVELGGEAADERRVRNS